MGFVDTCMNLEAIYKQTRAESNWNRFGFLLGIAGIDPKVMMAPDTLMSMKVLSQTLAKKVNEEPDPKVQQAVANVSTLLATAYDGFLSIVTDGYHLPVFFGEDTFASFEEVQEFFSDFLSKSKLNTSSLEEPYRVLCGDNYFTLSHYDESGKLQILYPKPENHSFRTILTSNSLFITSLQDLQDLSGLLISLAREAPEPQQRQYYSNCFQALQKAVSLVDVMDSLVIFKDIQGKVALSKLPVKITRPRVVNESLAKATFKEPMTGQRCTAWIMG